MIDADSASIFHDGQSVESIVVAGTPEPGLPPPSDVFDLPPLTAGDGVEGVPEAEGPARLHLDERDGASPAYDQIDLAARKAHVSIHDRPPASLELGRRALLVVPPHSVCVQLPILPEDSVPTGASSTIRPAGGMAGWAPPRPA